MNYKDYKKWVKKPNTISKGIVLTKEVFVDVKNPDKKRLIRIYLPSTYDFSNPEKRFPVIYMMDGKNLFDDYTSFVGEWGVDETIEEAIKNGNSEGIIVVGIDSAKSSDDRALEMVPQGISPKSREGFNENSGYAEILGHYIFHELKEEIDRDFYTLSDKSHTAVGGSSMGGLMAFFLAVHYPQYVGYSFSFSPAFFLFKKRSWKEYLEREISLEKEIGQIYFYVGGRNFERLFIKPTIYTYDFMRKSGYSQEHLNILYDSKQEHNEAAWRIYFPDALSFFNYLK